MMSNLISREKAIETLKEYEIVESDNFTRMDSLSMMTVATIANCIEAIEELPTAEPERKKGEWIKEDRGHVEYTGVCSECGFSSIWYDTQEYFNFCPNCGCDMRGKK